MKIPLNFINSIAEIPNVARFDLPACQSLSGKHIRQYRYTITRKKRHRLVIGIWRAGNNGNYHNLNINPKDK